jgi:hypothetical protein
LAAASDTASDADTNIDAGAESEHRVSIIEASCQPDGHPSTRYRPSAGAAGRNGESPGAQEKPGL